MYLHCHGEPHCEDERKYVSGLQRLSEPLLIQCPEFEVLRLEKRYARRTHKNAYKGNLSYDNGEYVARHEQGGRGPVAKSSKQNIKIRDVMALKWR